MYIYSFICYIKTYIVGDQATKVETIAIKGYQKSLKSPPTNYHPNDEWILKMGERELVVDNGIIIISIKIVTCLASSRLKK